MLKFHKLLKFVTKNLYFKKYIQTSICLSTADNMEQNLFIPYQVERPKCRRKISVVGAGGFVGSACAYNLILSRICDEVVMIDIPQSEKKLRGFWTDISQAIEVYKGPKVYMSTDLQDTRNSNVIVISSGVNIKPNQTRLDIVKQNVEIYKKIIQPMAKLSPQCVFVIVTNPCDILAYACWKYSGFDKYRCIGTGTTLETGRFRLYLSRRLGISPKSVNAFVIGEHGNSCVPIWHAVSVFGTRLKDIDPYIGEKGDKHNWNAIVKEIREVAPRLIKFKECTNWAISLSTEQICKAIIKDTDEVFPVSVCIKGYHCIESDVYISYPAVLGNMGVKKLVNIGLTCHEIEQLKESVNILDKVLKTVNF